MKMIDIFARSKRRTATRPQPRDWASTLSPRDWADLPTHHPRNERDAL
jgi:hypothetical protein